MGLVVGQQAAIVPREFEARDPRIQNPAPIWRTGRRSGEGDASGHLTRVATTSAATRPRKRANPGMRRHHVQW